TAPPPTASAPGTTPVSARSRTTSSWAPCGAALRGRELQRDDDLPCRLSRLHRPVRLGDLIEPVDRPDDRPDLVRLHQEDEVRPCAVDEARVEQPADVEAHHAVRAAQHVEDRDARDVRNGAEAGQPSPALAERAGRAADHDASHRRDRARCGPKDLAADELEGDVELLLPDVAVRDRLRAELAHDIVL